MRQEIVYFLEMSAFIEIIGLIVAFILIELVGLDAMLIVMMWLVFACIGLGLIGEFIITPWRDEMRERAKQGSPCVRDSISVAPESGRIGRS